MCVDLQIDTAIEVKGNTPRVIVTWEESEEKEGDETEKTSSAGNEMMGRKNSS